MAELQKTIEETKTKKFMHWHKVSAWLALYDVIAVCAAYLLMRWLVDREETHETLGLLKKIVLKRK